MRTATRRTLLTIALATSAAIAGSALAADAKPKPDAKDKAGAKAKRAVDRPTEGVALLIPTRGNDGIQGYVVFRQDDDLVHITGKVRGLTPGKHGFHIHEFGDLRTADGSSAGGHYNPEGTEHGGPDDAKHHAGDLGNIVADEDGNAVIDMTSKAFEVHFVIGRAIVVHAGADDLASQPSGDAGARVALGVIGFSNVEKKLPRSAKKSSKAQ